MDRYVGRLLVNVKPQAQAFAKLVQPSISFGAKMNDNSEGRGQRSLAPLWVGVIGLLLESTGTTASSLASVVEACVDYGCDVRRTALLSAEHWRELDKVFARVDSPVAEREAVAKAIGRLEQIVGDQVGTGGDLPSNTADHGGIGQLDCVSESINSERYLQLLNEASLLRWHAVRPRAKRAPLLFDTHWTAVIEQIDTGEAFSVDSWYGSNGDEPYIVDLEHWRRGAAPSAR